MSASILFSDVSGSTRMYEMHGDVVAQRMIDRAIHEMTRIVEKKSGRVIKTMGDEVMALFSDPGDALWAACDMQQAMHERGDGPALLPVSLHIGIHSGRVIEDGGDAFGDTVNIAARIASLAKPEQILTTAETIKAARQLALPSFRRLAPIPLKGREELVDLREILWTNPPDEGIDGLTVLDGMASSLARRADTPALALTTHGNSVAINRLRPRIAIGRDPASDLVVRDPMASRTHAIIEMRSDKFVLIDQSSNGTYVTPRLDSATNATISLRREEFLLSGEGTIRLGHNRPDSPWFVAYVTA